MTERDAVAALDEHGHRVQHMFDRIAHGYDRANRWMSFGVDARWRATAVASMMPADAPAQPQVLDLCAGTLDSSLEIHKRYPAAEIVAGDFASEMLELGSAKLVGSALAKIHPQTMDAHVLPFADDSLDAIFCAFGVRNLSNLAQATDEQARCLRPGGTLTILEFFRPTTWIPRLLHAAYSRTFLPLIGWAATGDLAAYTYLPRSIGGFETIADYSKLLADHGFVEVDARPLTLGMAWIVRAVRRSDDGVGR